VRLSGYSSGEAPHGISYHASRAARALAGSLGWSMNSKHFPPSLHTMLIVGPEHAKTFAGDGLSSEDLRRHPYESVQQSYRALSTDESHGEGTNSCSARVARGPSPRQSAASPRRFAASSEHTTGSRSVTRAIE